MSGKFLQLASALAWLVCLLVLTCALAFFMGYIEIPNFSQATAAPTATEQGETVFLTTTTPPPQNKPGVIPPWIFSIVLIFLIIQLLCTITAFSQAKSPIMTEKKQRQIEFFCEAPMFLGLLGALTGICTTHFITGNAAAPLAYLTSLNGIVLYMFTKLIITLSLPEPTKKTEGKKEELFTSPLDRDW